MILRIWRSFYFFVLGFGLMFSGGIAFAETIPATVVATDQHQYRCNKAGTWGPWVNANPDYSGACSAAGGWYGYYDGQTACWTASNTYPKLTCSGQYVTVYSCPAGQNWTLSGSTCTRPDCDPGTSFLNGACVSNTCPDGSPRSYEGLCRGSACNNVYGPTAPPGVDYGYQTTCTQQGCKQTSWKSPTATVVQGTNGECTPGTNTDPLPCPVGTTSQTIGATTKCYPSDGSTCASRGQCSGAVNGVTICVACGPGVSTSTTTGGTQQTTTTPPDGPSQTTSQTTGTTSTVTPGDSPGTTIINTTTTTTNGDGTVTTKTESQPLTDFCKTNPADPLCTKQSECDKNPDLVQCKKLGSSPVGPEVQGQNKSISQITPTTGGNGSCPANVALPRGAEFSYAPMCDLATGVRPVVLAIAWLIAGGMIFAWFKA